MYIEEDVSHADAKVAARQCYLMIQRLNQQEIRLWKNIKNNETTNWEIDFEE
jgi:hypothetical protein